MNVPKFERILRAAANSKPSNEQLEEWRKRDEENERLQTWDFKHPSKQPRSALTGWTGRTLDIDNVQFAPGYSELGYDDPKRGILFANWNDCSNRVYSILERAGYSCEWEDEWSTCSDCGNAVRTSGNCYGWQPSFVLMNKCETVCIECLLNNDSAMREYLESIENNPKTALNIEAINPADYGYTRISESGAFEHGFHPGQTDDPQTIFDAYKNEHPNLLFRISDVGQFDIHFELWERIPDEQENEQ